MRYLYHYKKDGEDAVAVQQDESLMRYRYLRVTGSASHIMADVAAAASTCTEAGGDGGPQLLCLRRCLGAADRDTRCGSCVHRLPVRQAGERGDV